MGKSMRALALVSAVGLSLALGCGRDDARQAGDAAQRTTEEAAAGRTADEAREGASDVAAGARGAPGADPAARCKDLAAQEAWNEALEPCTAAHAAHPDDMAIEHALQQARAAAGR